MALKRHVMSWGDFKKNKETLPIEKGKSKTPENSKKKEGKAESVATLEDPKKHTIPADKKAGKKSDNPVMDDPKKITIKDDSDLKKATVKKDVMDNKIPVSKKAVPTVKKATTPNLAYAKKKLGV